MGNCESVRAKDSSTGWPSVLGWGQDPTLHWRRAPVQKSIPDRGPGHAFVPMAHAGCRRHTKVSKLGALVGGRVRCRLCHAPHPDPCGGQAPALHFLIPPSTIGLQFGTFRPWRAGIEVDWRAHPGSESGTCFRTNRPCRRAPAHQGTKIGGAPAFPWIPAPYQGTGHVFDRRNDEIRE